MKRRTLLLALLTLTTALPALKASPSDTLTILSYRAIEAQPIRTPIFCDSINIRGEAYDAYSLMTGLPKGDLDSPFLRDLETADGTVSLEPGKLHRLYASLLTTAYEEAELLITCPEPYKVSFDGKYLGGKNRHLDAPATDRYSLQVRPSAHRILTIEVEPSKATDLRISILPKRTDHTLTLRTDAGEYMSMDFGFTGETITGVALSRSGRFTLLTTNRITDYKSYRTTTLYDRRERVGELPAELASGRWMPSSDRLYFTRQTDTGRQLLTYDPATRFTELLCGTLPEGAFVIAPTEDRLIFYRETKGDPHNPYVDRVLSRDDHRMLTGPRSRYDLWLYDLRDNSYRPLTYGYRSTALQDISGDGRRIIFSVTDNEVTTSPFFTTAFCELDLETMQADTLFDYSPHISYVGYTAEEGKLLVLGTPDAFDGLGRAVPDGVVVNTYETEIYLYDRAKGAAEVFTKEFKPAVQTVRPARNRMRVLFSADDRDYRYLYTLDLKSGKILRIDAGEDYVSSFDLDADGRTFVSCGESVNSSSRAHIGDADRGSSELLYDLASLRMKNLRMGETVDWDFTMPNGEKVPGRYYLPPTFDASKKYPMLVYYYAGTTPAGRTFDWYYSQPMYAAQDYVVLVLNPSGTIGWGQDYSARHVNTWGKQTADEIISAVKGFVAEHPYVNGERIGCFGASYGGFTTEYLLTETDLFACAVSHAGISTLSSYWGQGTWGIGYSTVASTDSYPWNNPDLYTGQSPLFRADRIHTPLLLTHGTSDTNVPFGESVQLYNALKILGRPVELVRVYGQDHHIMELHRRELWMWSMMAWFQKWLKDDPTWWDSLYPERHY